ncbi:MAG: MFS transporter [Sphingobacteriales bacterium]|nr:MFS transporter [Sphingobacteriales bacterium]MBI3720614.1 MFS transporter [Sphingobacteriales bacterium]
MQTASKRVINGWAMFDWANSVYNLVITSTIFPAYFEAIAEERREGDVIYVRFMGREFVNTSLYNYALAFALLIVAIILPLLTSIADYKGNKKSFMAFFFTIGSLACGGLYFFKDINTLWIGIVCMIIACICFWSSYVFSNSFLPEIAAPEDRDSVSARGFAYGYIGSVILQLICFVFVMKYTMFGFANEGEGSRVSFVAVCVWWLGFGYFSLSRLPKPLAAGSNNSQNNILTNGYRELAKVWNQIKTMSVIKRYLGAFFFYNMGVQTVMLAATLYGKSELEIPVSNLIIAILLIQLVAIPGAFVISRLSGKIGNFQSLMVVIFFWVLICVAAYFVPKGNILLFYILGACVGFVMGGIQSLSRSTYSKLMPETKDTASFFSFYDVTEKVAVVIGMLSFGYITELTGTQRLSVLALATFFLIGLIILYSALKKEKELAS